MTNEQAIQYIDSLIGNYDCPKKVDKLNPQYRLCEIWLSEMDIIALNMAKEALWDTLVKNQKVFQMREPTPEEQEKIKEYIDSISLSTGANFYKVINRSELKN